MYTKFEIVKKRRKKTLKDFIENLITILSDYESYVIELSEKSPVQENSSNQSEKKQVIFSDSVLQSNYVPIFLKRKENEDYSPYLKRIKDFLEDFNVDRLNEILGEIDPSREENEPAITLLKGVIKNKKEEVGKGGCNLI